MISGDSSNFYNDCCDRDVMNKLGDAFNTKKYPSPRLIASSCVQDNLKLACFSLGYPEPFRAIPGHLGAPA